ncbi:rCG23707 [Rattus norvegicus]|uniref:RCG23707 n=1 Tax=Rattus norvegicus TaxID=10116 RepID=A6JW56_RAT|nr:rCG23707 [Rattus norvegicus]
MLSTLKMLYSITGVCMTSWSY